MTEVDVALTDYGLVVEGAVLAWLVARRPAHAGRSWFVLFFAAIAVGALAGGTVHGFFLEPASLGQRLLWPIALLAVGVTAWAAWSAGAAVGFSPPVARGIAVAAALQFLFYAAMVLLVTQDFSVAIAEYVPAALFLLAVFAWAGTRPGGRRALPGVAGLVLTLLASGVQYFRVAPHPVYLNHNALYHVLQGLALALIYLGARPFVTTED
jgi:hypothetical protein